MEPYSARGLSEIVFSPVVSRRCTLSAIMSLARGGNSMSEMGLNSQSPWYSPLAFAFVLSTPDQPIAGLLLALLELALSCAAASFFDAPPMDVRRPSRSS